jgi:DNA repair exonuclease SbcCD nuclease subunit
LHPLYEKIDYLALGHFHKQFTINNWIFNPGSSEPVCSADFTYKRGIFLVNIFKSSKGGFSKTVKIIRLHNRPYQYEMIFVNRYFAEQQNFNLFIINQLKQRIQSSFRHKKKEVDPVLLLHLRGIEPAKNCRNKGANLRKLICNKLPFIDVRIYEKFKTPIKSLENYVG